MKEIEEKKTIVIPELKIEVDIKLTNMGNKWNKYTIPQGKRILTFSEIAFLYENNKYNILLGLNKTHEFFKHPLNSNLIGIFTSGLDWADGGSRFIADVWDVGYADYGLLGVRFVRDLK